jgi:hypothetical protein
MKTKIVITIVIVIFALLSLAISSVINSPQKIRACTEEAKMCPDGSSVSRGGPNCEFAECPKVITQTTVITSNTTQNTNVVIPNIANTTKLNKKIIINGVSITPIELVSDSRCAVDVQCVWAGTVEIRVRLESGKNIQESRLTLGSSVKFLNTNIEFKNVLPPPYSKVSIKPTDYYFEFAMTSAQPTKVDTTQKPIF